MADRCQISSRDCFGKQNAILCKLISVWSINIFIAVAVETVAAHFVDS